VNNFVCFANQGSNNILGYQLNRGTGVLTPLAGSPIAAGLLPSVIAISN